MNNPNSDNSNIQSNIQNILEDYNPDAKVYDFIYQGTKFVRVCSVNPNFILDFYILSARVPNEVYNGFEISINRATNAEVRGPMNTFKIGELSDPILVDI